MAAWCHHAPRSPPLRPPASCQRAARRVPTRSMRRALQVRRRPGEPAGARHRPPQRRSRVPARAITRCTWRQSPNTRCRAPVMSSPASGRRWATAGTRARTTGPEYPSHPWQDRAPRPGAATTCAAVGWRGLL